MTHLELAIAAAEDLAWRPTANLPGSVAYHDRREAHARLVEILAGLRSPRGASPELRYLVAAMRRVAAASFSNRYGLPYYERREAVSQLRGCLDVYRKAAAA